MNHTVHPVILCGGSGTRLWPLSTPEKPKQFKALTSDKSMIEETADRFTSSTDPRLTFTPPLVVGSVKHRHLLEQSLPDAHKILEPFGRNSAPAVAAACLAYDADALMLILPADHAIGDVPAFHLAIAAAAKAAEDGSIVTFGIEPTHPATGYGYIKAAHTDAQHMPVPVESFVEKPDAATAQSYLDLGGYYWNAGIFLFRAGVMLKALENHAPKVLSGTRAAMPNGDEKIRTLDPKTFAETPSISIDYAVMERAENVQTVPVDMAWSDVGSYPALHGLLTGERNENYFSGPVLIKDSEALFVRSEGPIVSVNGVSDLAIVATADHVMVTSKSNESAAKELGETVLDQQYTLSLAPENLIRTKNWLWNTFAHWAKVGWDDAHGGFVERLHLDGVADLNADRRVRVQARQIFCFSKAICLGWPDVRTAKSLVDKGISYVNERLRHPDEGFVHIVSSTGHVISDRRDLYDHAFLILAGSAAFHATGNSTALKIAEDALNYANARLKDREHGGWFESSEFELPRRANPHMHMLEAMLEFHMVTKSEVALKHALEIVQLFETKFFDPTTDVMAELFEDDWTPISEPGGIAFEPGHHYEWSVLLRAHDKLSHRDTESFRRRMIRKALTDGTNKKTGFAFNSVRANAQIIESNSRLWHQLEKFCALLAHPSIAANPVIQTLIHSIFEKYLDRSPPGTWIDELNQNGDPVSNHVPASMLYHIVTALGPIVGRRYRRCHRAFSRP